jgi:hypothetical protein
MTITEIVKFCKSSLRIVAINSNHLCGSGVIEGFGTWIAKRRVTHLSFFPEALLKGMRNDKIMKFLKITFFTAVLTLLMSFSAFAQKDDKKQERPKPPPPTVNPGGSKPPRGNPPKGDDKPKKPEMSWFLFAKNGSSEESA